jgi:hypothetical protein
MSLGECFPKKRPSFSKNGNRKEDVGDAIGSEVGKVVKSGPDRKEVRTGTIETQQNKRKAYHEESYEGQPCYELELVRCKS